MTRTLATSHLPLATVLNVPSSSTACIQEMHLMILHSWCFLIDAAFVGNNGIKQKEDQK
jgi:hypothetical protein